MANEISQHSIDINQWELLCVCVCACLYIGMPYFLGLCLTLSSLNTVDSV